MSRALLVSMMLAGTAEHGLPQGGPGETAAEAQTESVASEPSGLRSAGEVRETLKAILESPEYRRLARPKKEEEPTQPRQLPRWLDRFLDWLFGTRKDTEPRASVSWPVVIGEILRWVLYGIVGAAFAWVLFLILKSVLRRSAEKPNGRPQLPGRSEELSPSTPPGEFPAEEYLQRALGFAQAGKYKEATRQLLLGAMSWTERQGLVRYRKGLTNRDYLRAIWTRPRQREPLAAIILTFDQIYFGRRPATAERFYECLKSYRTGFGTT